jgi:hypothetical protein
VHLLLPRKHPSAFPDLIIEIPHYPPSESVGRIHQERDYYDTLALMEQLGVAGNR